MPEGMVALSLLFPIVWLAGCVFGARFLDWSGDDEVQKTDVDLTAAAILKIARQQGRGSR